MFKTVTLSIVLMASVGAQAQEALLPPATEAAASVPTAPAAAASAATPGVVPATAEPTDGRINEVLIAVRRPQDTPGSGITIGLGFPSMVAALVVDSINLVKDVKKNFTHASEKMGVLVVGEQGLFKVCEGTWKLVPTDQLKNVTPGQYVRLDRDIKDGILPVVKEGGVPHMYDETSDAYPCTDKVKKLRERYG